MIHITQTLTIKMWDDFKSCLAARLQLTVALGTIFFFLLLLFTLIFLSSLTKPADFTECVGDELPVGWEQAYDYHRGGIYYVDHRNRKWSSIYSYTVLNFLHECDSLVSQKYPNLRTQYLSLAPCLNLCVLSHWFRIWA